MAVPLRMAEEGISAAISVAIAALDFRVKTQYQDILVYKESAGHWAITAPGGDRARSLCAGVSWFFLAAPSPFREGALSYLEQMPRLSYFTRQRDNSRPGCAALFSRAGDNSSGRPRIRRCGRVLIVFLRYPGWSGFQLPSFVALATAPLLGMHRSAGDQAERSAQYRHGLLDLWRPCLRAPARSALVHQVSVWRAAAAAGNGWRSGPGNRPEPKQAPASG